MAAAASSESGSPESNSSRSSFTRAARSAAPSRLSSRSASGVTRWNPSKNAAAASGPRSPRRFSASDRAASHTSVSARPARRFIFAPKSAAAALASRSIR